MKTINQLKEEIKQGSITEKRAANIELYKRLFNEVKERINYLCYVAISDGHTESDVAFEIFHIIDAFSYSAGEDFSRNDFAEDLKAHIFSMSGRYSNSYGEWLKALYEGSEDLQ